MQQELSYELTIGQYPDAPDEDEQQVHRIDRKSVGTSQLYNSRKDSQTYLHKIAFLVMQDEQIERAESFLQRNIFSVENLPPDFQCFRTMDVVEDGTSIVSRDLLGHYLSYRNIRLTSSRGHLLRLHACGNDAEVCLWHHIQIPKLI